MDNQPSTTNSDEQTSTELNQNLTINTSLADMRLNNTNNTDNDKNPNTNSVQISSAFTAPEKMKYSGKERVANKKIK